MAEKHYEVIIVGAGPTGLSFAASLAAENINVLVIEQQGLNQITEPVIDGRDIALTHYSKKILTDMQVWEQFDSGDISTIKHAQVLDGESTYPLEFSSRSTLGAQGSLGFIIPNYRIRQVLYDHVKGLGNVDIITSVSVKNAYSIQAGVIAELDNGDQVGCDLLVAADSRFSALRRQMGIAASMRDFGRSVIVCQAEHEQNNPQIAYECFRYGSTLAVLPVNEKTASIVVTLPTDQANAVMHKSPEHFSAMISNQFERRLGQMTIKGERYSYPLIGVLARSFIAERFALIGDAAVGMHPVTAHGFNLGQRGQYLLANQVIEAHRRGESIACDYVLKAYNREHQRHCRPMYFGTNLLVQLFTDDKPVAKFIRKTVMHVSNNLPPLKRSITNRLTEING